MAVLREFLGDETVKMTQCSWDREIFEIEGNNEEYLVLTDKEADKRTRAVGI